MKKLLETINSTNIFCVFMLDKGLTRKLITSDWSKLYIRDLIIHTEEFCNGCEFYEI